MYHSTTNDMKYHIPQIPYNIAIPNGGGTGAPVQAPPSRLPQHLRSAVTNGLCRLQPADPPAAAPGPWSDPPDPLTLREEHLIGQLLAQLDRHAPAGTRPIN